MPKPREQSSILKKFPRHPGQDRAGQGCQACRDRDLVRRRSQDRTEEQDHPSLGQTRNAASGAVRSAHRFHLHLRSHLSCTWQGCSAHPAAMQYRGDEPAPGRDRHSRRAWLSRRTPRRPGGMTPVAPARDTAQHHARATAGEVPRTHMGGLNSREFLLTASWLRTPTTVSDPRSEPFDMTRLVAELDQTHIRSASKQARHQYPAYGGQGSGGRDHSQPRLFRPSSGFGRPPGSAGTDQTPVDGDLRCAR